MMGGRGGELVRPDDNNTAGIRHFSAVTFSADSRSEMAGGARNKSARSQKFSVSLRRSVAAAFSRCVTASVLLHFCQDLSTQQKKRHRASPSPHDASFSAVHTVHGVIHPHSCLDPRTCDCKEGRKLLHLKTLHQPFFSIFLTT